MSREIRAVVIGGSAGSFQVVGRLLHALPREFPLPVILCLHRLKHVRSGFVEALSFKSNVRIVEPYDKEQICSGSAYLAPANYHLYVELGGRFALSTEGMVNHSRPSIDLTFYSVARAYREKALGILLSGANRDGAEGLRYVKQLGGEALVQAPEECEVPTMPEAAMALTAVDGALTTDGLITHLRGLC